MEDNEVIRLYSIGSSTYSLQCLVVLFTIINALVMAATIPSNLTALIVLIKQRTLHSPSNTLLASMCFADILSALLVQTFYERLLSCLRGNTTMSITNDMVMTFHANFAACKGIICLLTSMISADRYLAICCPFKYLSTATIKKYIWITLLLSGSWVVYSLCLILILPLRMFCGSIIIVIFTSMTVMNFCYTRVLIIAHKQRVRVHVMGEIRGTIASPPHMREKGKVLVIFVEMFIFNIFNMPLFIFAICYLSGGFNGSHTSPFVVLNVGYTLSNITSLLNPFVYCFRSSEVRKAAKRLTPKMRLGLIGFRRSRKVTKVVPISI